MFKNKFFGFAMIAALVLTFIMVTVQIPLAKSAPKDLPVAIVNEDQGPMGAKIVDKVRTTKTKSKNQVLKWTEVSSDKKLKQAMDKQKYYGALVIPKDFSKNLKSLAMSHEALPADIKVVINQEKNNTLAPTVQNILTGIVNGMGSGIRGQMVAQLSKQNVMLPAAAVNRLATPVVASVVHEHEYKKLAATSSVFFQPIWLSSLVASLMLYYAGQQRKKWHSKRHVMTDKTLQIVGGAVIAVVIGFATTGYVYWILDYHFNNLFTLGTFLSFASFAFIMLFSGFIAWLGFPAIVLFALLLFFSVPLMTLAPQFLPSFYQDWILPWLPMKFLYDGTRSLLYYGASLWNPATSALVVVMVVGIVVFYLETFSSKRKQQIERIK